MKNWWWAMALGVMFGLLSAGVILLASQPPRGNEITLLPPPTKIPIQVHVSGAIHNPGVYALAPGSRVRDAIQAAGGLTDKADDTSLNLAAQLEDGARLQIPTQIQVDILTPGAVIKSEDEQSSSRSTPPNTESPHQPININSADQSSLETLSGIGPVTAQKIIAFREENGPFTSIEEIQKVSGIGPVTFEKIKDFITVDE